MIGYEQKLARVLDRMGGLYTLNDILTAIGERRMQSHVVNNSWAVTQINQYPRARTLQVIALVGDAKDLSELHDKVLDYADEINAGVVAALGRKGWIPWAEARGWRLKAKNYLYHREL